ncbi:MAG: hypothetical protein JW395_1662 [Nitrospira sp.]|nr:hypothetical protein [Nitrospira sp.]
MTLRKSAFKAILAAGLLAVAGLGGIPQQAQALTFNAGDAVLVIYGNGTEYYRNLGPSSAIPSTVTIASSFMSQLGGAAPIEYTILGGNAANFGALPTSTFEGTAVASTNQTALSGWAPATNGSINQQQYWNTIVNWATQVGTIAGSEHVLAASETNSFSTLFGTLDRLNGAFPRRMSSNIDTNLFLLGRSFLPLGNQTAQSALGQAMLTVLAGSGNGQLTFAASAVPLPAAVVLFGSGLIGLIGIARRKYTQSQSQA